MLLLNIDEQFIGETTCHLPVWVMRYLHASVSHAYRMPCGTAASCRSPLKYWWNVICPLQCISLNPLRVSISLHYFYGFFICLLNFLADMYMSKTLVCSDNNKCACNTAFGWAQSNRSDWMLICSGESTPFMECECLPGMNQILQVRVPLGKHYVGHCTVHWTITIECPAGKIRLCQM